MYTTYFYTAGEAVIHGYAPGTHARIVAVADPATHRTGGTIWSGTVGTGEVQLVPTGAGVFGLLSDKKAAILVGTPNSCTAVGYFVKDDEGRFLAPHFYTQLPSGPSGGDEHVVVWAYEPTAIAIRDPATQKVVRSKIVPAGGRLELGPADLRARGSEILEIEATTPVAVEVYYDEGFIVPSRTGGGAGTDFLTFVGAMTQGNNDLDVVALDQDAAVTLTDVDTHKPIWSGRVAAGTLHTTNLRDRYVRVTSDQPVEVMVAAFATDAPGYAEHHFATGREGGGIDTDFELTTSSGIWLFSYFADNAITVTNATTGASVFTGALQAGTGKELDPGNGLYRVHASKGLSVMGGANACGADYSPAAGMFAVDDAMLRVLQQVTAARVDAAQAQGIVLTPEAAAAPAITADEWQRYGAPAKHAYAKMSLEEANDRAAKLKK